MIDGSTEFDVAIIGAGPAGMSAAVWCRDLGLSVVLLEKEAQAGGQLLSIFNPVTNYLGISARNGRELNERFAENVFASDFPLWIDSTVTGVEPGSGPTRSVFLENGRVLSVRAVVLATGVQRRSLGIPGEEELAGKGILASGARDRESVKGKTVVIVGGGDAALENALILSEFALKVYVVHRGSEFRAREEFVQEAADRPNVEFVMQTTVRSIDGDEAVRSVSVFRSGTSETNGTGGTNGTSLIPADAVLIRIGVEPNTELFRNKVDLDASGYVLVDQLGRTSRSGLYAIGDVANPVSPTIATAAGTGATAAKAIYASLTLP